MIVLAKQTSEQEATVEEEAEALLGGCMQTKLIPTTEFVFLHFPEALEEEGVEQEREEEWFRLLLEKQWGLMELWQVCGETSPENQ